MRPNPDSSATPNRTAERDPDAAPGDRDAVRIDAARVPEDLPLVRRLFREYADALGVDLCFQGFEEELAALPGKYAPPAGRLLIAWRGDAALGCVALRPIDESACEMKRLYLRPQARGTGLGRALAERICDEARVAGYARIYLDTLPSMTAAVALYASLGFRPAEAYVYNPLEGAMFLVRALNGAPHAAHRPPDASPTPSCPSRCTRP